MQQSLDGSLFVYDKKNQLISYFNNISSEYNVILVGGLSFNILSLPYTEDLSVYCKENNLGLYIPQFRSHPNYGIFNLDNDISDLNSLLRLIKGKIILIGNSTGCQVIIRPSEANKNISLCILQGPVSDVEYERSVDKDLGYKLELARKCDGVLPFKHEGNYITGKRYLDLFESFGCEDIFSSYLEDEFYQTKLNPNKTRCAFIISECDEFAVINLKDKLKLVENSFVYEIKKGDHFLTDKNSREEFITIVDIEINKLYK